MLGVIFLREPPGWYPEQPGSDRAAIAFAKRQLKPRHGASLGSSALPPARTLVYSDLKLLFFSFIVLSLGVPFAKTLPEQAAKLTGCPEPVGRVCCAGEDSKPTALRQVGECKMDPQGHAGECRDTPSAMWFYLVLGFFPTCLVNKQTRGWKYRGEGQHRRRGTSRSLCLRRQLTWVMPGGGPRSFWLLGRGGADDIPKAVV